MVSSLLLRIGTLVTVPCDNILIIDDVTFLYNYHTVVIATLHQYTVYASYTYYQLLFTSPRVMNSIV